MTETPQLKFIADYMAWLHREEHTKMLPAPEVRWKSGVANIAFPDPNGEVTVRAAHRASQIARELLISMGFLQERQLAMRPIYWLDSVLFSYSIAR